MFGAIAGDVIGSVYEGSPTKAKDFPLFTEWSRFTDDTVLTVAVAEKLLRGGDYVDLFHEAVREYPLAGYGGTFILWPGTASGSRTTRGATAQRCGSARSGRSAIRSKRRPSGAPRSPTTTPKA